MRSDPPLAIGSCTIRTRRRVDKPQILHGGLRAHRGSNMRTTILLVSAILVFGPLSGCLNDSGDAKDIEGRSKGAAKQISGVVQPLAVTKLTDLAFGDMKIIDKDHAGGEPV